MVSSQEPRIEIPENNVNHWKVLVYLGAVTLDQHYFVPVAQFLQVVVAGPSIRSYFTSWQYVLHNERHQCFPRAIWQYLEP